MGREHDRYVLRYFIQFLDEDRPLGLKASDDMPIMHDLVSHINRGAVFLQALLDNLDRSVNAGA